MQSFQTISRIIFCGWISLASMAQAKPSVVTLQLNSGKTVEGELREISATEVNLVTKKLPAGEEAAAVPPVAVESEEKYPLADVFKITTKDSFEMPPTFIGGELIAFPGGDRLRIQLLESILEDKTSYTGGLVEDPTNEKRVPNVNPNAMLGLLLGTPEEGREKWLSTLKDERKLETVLLSNGDRKSGGFVKLDKALELLDNGAQASLDRKSIVALGFANGSVEYPVPEGTYLEVYLVDGSRLGVKDAKTEKERLVGTARFGSPVAIKLENISRIYIRQPNVVLISNLKADAENFTAYNGIHPNRISRNQTLTGKFFKVDGQFYDQGIATYSRTLLAYKFKKDKPHPKLFQARVAMDEREGGAAGSFVVKIIIAKDGKSEEKYVSPAITLGHPQDISVDISEGSLLVLATEMGIRGNVQDHADWLEARLVY